MKTASELITLLGNPHKSSADIVLIDLPYPMRLAWDLDTKVEVMRCNKITADAFKAVFKDLLKYYGYESIKALGIDLFGGCYNVRRMRGGSSWSSHSWGISIDLDPSRNKLRESKRTARFARDEYKPMIRIFEAHGFKSLGVEKDFDWMHFQYENF